MPGTTAMLAQDNVSYNTAKLSQREPSTGGPTQVHLCVRGGLWEGWSAGFKGKKQCVLGLLGPGFEHRAWKFQALHTISPTTHTIRRTNESLLYKLHTHFPKPPCCRMKHTLFRRLHLSVMRLLERRPQRSCRYTRW